MREFEKIEIIPIEPKEHSELYEEIIKVAKIEGMTVKPLQATSLSMQERIFEDYFAPYKDQIERWENIRIEDIVYHGDQIDLSGFILWKTRDTTLCSSPHFWYLEPFEPNALQNFLVSLDIGKVVITAVVGSITIKVGEKLAKPLVNWLEKTSKKLKSNIRPSLFITSHGTVDEQRLTPTEKHLLAELAKKDYITFITGWDFLDKGREMINDVLQPTALIMEGGTVLYTKKDGWEMGEIKLFNYNDLNFVKKAWYHLVECTAELLDFDVVFMSQADKYSICVYVNPPDDIVKEELNSLRKNEVKDGDEFAGKMKEIGKKYNLKVNAEPIDNLTVKIKKDIDNIYCAEKVNALYRTFMPYKLEMKSDFALVTLLPENHKYRIIEREERTPGILNSLVKCVNKKMPGYENRITPQRDVCIDIFAMSKDEIVKSVQAIEKSGLKDAKEVIYIYQKVPSAINHLSRL